MTMMSQATPGEYKTFTFQVSVNVNVDELQELLDLLSAGRNRAEREYLMNEAIGAVVARATEQHVAIKQCSGRVSVRDI